MNENGCVVNPYLRPICTVHVCCITNLGYKRDDPTWTDRYFKLREEIENELHKS